MTTNIKKRKPLIILCGKVTAYFAVIITALLCLLAITYSSPWGAQITVKAINKLSPLSLVYKKGMLSETIELSSVKYKNDNLSILGTNVELHFHLRCLWENKWCINSLIADELAINILSKEDDDVNDGNIDSKIGTKLTNKTENKNVTIPIAIQADKFAVKLAKIHLSNQEITVKDFTSSVSINQHNFNFTQPSASLVNVNYIPSGSINVSHQKNVDLANTQLSSSDVLLPNINLPLLLAINNLKLNTLSIQQRNSKNSIQLTNTTMTGQWENNNITIQEFSTKYPEVDVLSLVGSIHTANNYPLKLQVNSSINTNSFWPQIENSTQHFIFDGNLSELNFTAKSKGTLALSTQGNINLLETSFPYSIQINANKVPLYNNISQVIHPSSISLTSKGDLTEQKLSVNSVINGLGYDNAVVTFKGEHSSKYKSSIGIEAFSLKDNNNDIHIKGNIILDDKPTWDLSIDSKGFTLPKTEQTLFGYPLTGNVKGTLDTYGVFDYENTTVTVSDTNLEGELNNIPFTAIGNLHLKQNWQLEPSNLSLSLFDSLFKIKGHNDSQWHVDGEIKSPKLNTFLPAINGNLITYFSIKGPLKNPIIEFNNNIKHFKYNDLFSPLITVNGRYVPFENHTLNGKIKSNQINWLGMNFNDVFSDIEGDINKQQIKLAWQGDLNSQLTVNGLWNEQTNIWKTDITAAEINYLTLKWVPNKTIVAQYNLNNKGISIDEHCWENIGFKVCLTQDVSFSTKGDIPLRLTMNTSVLSEPFIPKDLLVNTTIDGDINVVWDELTSEVNGNLSILAGNVLLEDNKLGLPVEIISAWDKGKFTFKINNQLIKTNLSLSPNSANQAWFYSTVNLFADIKIEEDFPLSGSASVNNFNLRPFRSLNHDIAQIDGTLNSKVALSGTLKRPNAEGEINITNAQLKLIKSPTVFDKGIININLLGDNAIFTGSFNVEDDIALITGNSNWHDEKQLKLNIQADKLNIMLPPQVKATIAPNINAELTKAGLNISGEVNVLEGVLEVNKLPEGSVELSKDVVFVDQEGKRIENEYKFNIETDIRLFIDKQFQLTGQGFNGTLEGALHIKHSSLTPLQVFGNLNIPGGRYHAYGQRLQIEKGKVAFNGPTDNPYVDLRATRTIQKENIKVGVEITGLANALALKLVSTPSMSRAQTLSYLLRGQALDFDNADDSGIGVALGAALANYSGILTQIEKLPLLNNLEVEGSSDQVSIAGYIGKKIYLKYGIGVDEPVNELTIRLFLMSRLWLETISSSSGNEDSVDIYYSFDTNL